MNNKTTVPTQQKSLRLWPGVVFVILQWLVRYVIPALFPDALVYGVLSVVVFGLGIVIWWLFFSRAPWFERWLAIPLILLALIGTFQILDRSIATANMGMMFTIYSIPVICLALVAWAILSRNFTVKIRRISLVLTIMVASGFWALLRTDGMDAELHHDLKWRWGKTAEEHLLTHSSDLKTTMQLDSAAMAKEPEWPGFRGRNRDGIIHGVKIATDWSKSKPVEMWRRSIGPGCSSFAVHGTLLYTQEQRGEFEMVTCYNLNTGEPVWLHRDSARFWDAHAGAGPRSTPTLCNGRVYTLGATGILNVLDPLYGSVVWMRDAAKDTKVKIPGWGYTSSPLVVDRTVFVAISGQILAYDIATGKLKWSGMDGGDSYSSPHLSTICGVKQILFINRTGISSFAMIDGKVLWNLPLKGEPIVQPALITNTDILISPGMQKEMQRITIKNGSSGWTIEERWKTNMLEPNHNDIVVHKGHIFGFEGPSLTCIDIENGIRKWKGGRYGGQLLLLADQDVLLLLTEKGDIALVKAIPDRFEELTKYPAIKGKTWNHPVLVGDVLVVRNTTEMVAFRLPTIHSI